MDDRFNTIAGWVLFAGIVALGSSIVAGEMFHAERPEKMGYPIANQLGPNLWGVVGEPIGKGANGFAFSPALSSIGGNWDFTSLNHWLSSPKAMAPGTKMTFAGLGDPQDRANVIAFLNQHSDAPKPLPAAPAVTAQKDTKPGSGPNNGPQKAEKEPVLPASAANKSPQTTGGPAGAKTKP
jgi:cytochrome c